MAKSGRKKAKSSREKILFVGKRMFPFGSTGWGWDPMLCLESIRVTMNSLYGELFRGSESFFQEILWVPQIDVYTNGDILIVDVDLPGVRREDISVHAASSLLIIDGNVERAGEVRESEFIVGERKSGRFHRSIPLPIDIVPEEIRSELREGILTIICPMKSG